jgi:hypothetical protein
MPISFAVFVCLCLVFSVQQLKTVMKTGDGMLN